MLDPAYRDQVLINEARTELKGSVAAWIGLSVVRTTEAQLAADASRRDLAAALFLERLASGVRADSLASSLGCLKRSLGLARHLVDAMLQHLKLESGLAKQVLTQFLAGELFERVMLSQGPAAAAQQVRLSIAGGRAALRTDLGLLARALENLVANAIRHAGGRRVVMGARTSRDHVTLWVIDDGRGLAPGDEARIFRPFEQGARVGAAGGFGLGLASTLALVELLSGACGVKPGVSRGAAFYIRLPRRPGGGDLECAA